MDMRELYPPSCTYSGCDRFAERGTVAVSTPPQVDTGSGAPLDSPLEAGPMRPDPTDSLGLAAASRRAVVWGVALLVTVLVSALLACTIGPGGVSPLTSLEILSHHLFGTPGQFAANQDAIVWNVRLPRVVMAVAVGAALAVSGAVLQAMVRNSLADPYVLGISSGASTGAAISILFGVGLGLGSYSLPVAAFVGAALACGLVLWIGRGGGTMRLLLAGVAVGYALSALTSFLVFASDSAEGSRSVMFWLLGSLSLSRWDGLLVVVVVVVAASTALLWAWSPRIDVLAVGDGTARSVGVDPDSTRRRLLLVVSASTGVAVAATGAIGFVGLVVPHLGRRLVGASHRRLLPTCALLGGLLLICGDVAARMVMAPRELPIGVVTALVGAPFLVILVRNLGAKGMR